jgi:DNA transformation protein
MFGGSGIYADGLCFAIELRGEVFLKTDEVTRANFAAVDSAPFIYVAKGKPRPTSY